MKKKKFFLDPKIVIQKCKAMMEKQIILFQYIWGPFYHRKDSYYAYTSGGNTVWVEQFEDAQFAAKTFGTKVTLLIGDVSMSRKWSARMSFRGNTRITDIIWVPDKKEYKEMVALVNNMGGLNAALLAAVRKIDLETINLSYSRDRQQLTVEILPYAGTYVWVKLPPAHCQIPLKSDEVQQIGEIVRIFEEVFAGNTFR